MQQEILPRAIERLVEAAEEAGFSVQDMLQLLSAGIGVETLLELIGRSLQARREEHPRSSRWVM